MTPVVTESFRQFCEYCRKREYLVLGSSNRAVNRDGDELFCVLDPQGLRGLYPAKVIYTGHFWKHKHFDAIDELVESIPGAVIVKEKL